MASGAARATLIGAWFVVVGAVAGGAAYLESLGPVPGPPVLASPEAAPEPQNPTHLEAPDLTAAEEPPMAPLPVESEDDPAPPPEAADEHAAAEPDADMDMLGAYDLPELPHPPESVEDESSQTLMDLAAEQLEALGGSDVSEPVDASEEPGVAMPTLAEMTGQGGTAVDPEHFQPQTAWPVETPSLHGTMPMMPRQTVDLAALGDDHRTVSDDTTPPVLAAPPAQPDAAGHSDAPVPEVPEAPVVPAEAPDVAVQEDHGAAPQPDSHQTMAEDGQDAAPSGPAIHETAAVEAPDQEPPDHAPTDLASTDLASTEHTPTIPEAETPEPQEQAHRQDEPQEQASLADEPEGLEPDGHDAGPAVAEAHDAPDAQADHQQETVAAVVVEGLSTEPDDRVVEVAEVGPLPVVGPSGARPADVYARPFDAPGERPVVAVVVGGLGLSSAATEAAIQSLPAAVTLSFSPYSGRLQDWVALARAAGHEVLIDLPMEPVDFPHSDPGPQALMTSLNADANMQRLEWVLSRATNYIGVGSYMGSRFAADAAAMRPVLQAINARGLIYLDNGQAIGNVAPTLSAEIGLPVLVSDIEVDQMAARQVIDDALAQVESKARSDGAALAIGTAYPVTIERLSVWTRSLADRGFALAPASALVGR